MLLTWLLTWSELLTSPPPEVSNSQALSNYVSNQPSFLAVRRPGVKSIKRSGHARDAAAPSRTSGAEARARRRGCPLPRRSLSLTLPARAGGARTAGAAHRFRH